MARDLDSPQRRASARSARIRTGIRSYINTLADIIAAWQDEDWRHLKYASWQHYLDGEYGNERVGLSDEMRTKAIEELRLVGMSQRAIAATVDVSQPTVSRGLSGSRESDGGLSSQVADLQGTSVKGSMDAPLEPVSATTPEPSPVPAPETDVTPQQGSVTVATDPAATAEKTSASTSTPVVVDSAAAGAGVTGGTKPEHELPAAAPFVEAMTQAIEETFGSRQEPAPKAEEQVRASWRKSFASALAKTTAPVKYEVEDVAANATEEMVAGLELAAAELTEFAGKVRAAHDGYTSGRAPQ